MHVVSDERTRPVEDITVLLVDDELIILNGLTSLLHKRFPHIALHSFTNGYDALRQIGEHVPDLLITDLFMPQIGGIELIEKAREMGCANYAVLTGFQEFELAHKAVKLHAMDYLLKPVDKKELYALVETVAHKRHDDWEVNRRQIEKVLMLAAVYGAQEGEQTLRRMHLQSCALLAALSGAGSAISAVEALDLRFGRHYDISSPEDEVGDVQLLLWVGDVSAEEMEQCRLEAFGPESAAAACGLIQSVSLHDLYLSLRTAMAGSQDRPAPPAAGDGTGSGDLPDLPSLLSKADSSTRSLAEALARYADYNGYDLPVWQAVAKAARLSALPRTARHAALQEWLSDLHRKTHIRSAVVLRSLEYIHNNLHRSIQLSDAAQAVYVQANYFSTLFHRETGMSFVQYVNYARVSLACEKLLGNPGIHNDQIAHECGFDNAGYFFRMFKRYTGVTPGEFRETLGK